MVHIVQLKVSLIYKYKIIVITFPAFPHPWREGRTRHKVQMKYSDIYFCVSAGNRRLIDEGWRMFLVAAIGSEISVVWGRQRLVITAHHRPQPPGNIVDTIGRDPDTFRDLIQEMCNYSSIQTSYIDTNHLAP